MGKKRKIIFCIVIILLIIIAIIYFFIEKNKKDYTSINDFENVKEVVKYLECDYIKETSTDEKSTIYLKIKHKPYENGTSYEKFYEQLISMIANVIDYKNFKLVDNSNSIIIEITCDQDNRTITNYTINGSKTYFADIANSNVIDNYEGGYTITSSANNNILQNCIENNWNFNSINFGTYESVFQDYYIYFDEGMKVKQIKDKIFNLVFTNRYTNPVTSNLKVGSDFDNVINTLGEPAYGSVDNNLIGYKTDDYYIFFSDSEISIYRVENFDTTEFATLVQTFIKNKSSSDLIENLTNLWKDYDYYYDDLNGTKQLIYTLKGIKIQFNINNEHGIVLYSNFNGNITPDLTFEQVINKEKEIPQYVYIKNSNLVYENEQERAIGIIYDDIIDFGSDNFVALPNNYDEDNYYNLLIISKNGDYPNSEINEYISSSIWLDNNNLAYSISGQGIYIYNATTRQTSTVITGNKEFIISGYEGNILSYDNTSIKVNL